MELLPLLPTTRQVTGLLSGAVLASSCSLLFSPFEEPAAETTFDAAAAPLPDLHYDFTIYDDDTTSAIASTGAWSDAPALFLEGSSRIGAGRLQCSSTAKCAQSDPSSLFAPCIAASRLTIAATLVSDSELDSQSNDESPSREIFRITEYGTSLSHVFRLGIDPGSTSKFAYQARIHGSDDDTVTYQTTNRPAQPAGQHHLIFVLDGQEGRFYIDGVAGSPPDNSLPLLVNDSDDWRLKIGSDQSEVSYQWAGEIAELDFYCSALSPDEAQAAYQASRRAL